MWKYYGFRPSPIITRIMKGETVIGSLLNGTVTLRGATLIPKLGTEGRPCKLHSIENIHPYTDFCSVGIAPHNPRMSRITFYAVRIDSYLVECSITGELSELRDLTNALNRLCIRWKEPHGNQRTQ